MPLPPGLLRLRLRYHYPQRCVCFARERASKRGPRRVAAWRAAETRPAAHVVARALEGRGRCATVLMRAETTSGWVFVRLVVKRPFPRHKSGAVLVAAATPDPTPQSPSLRAYRLPVMFKCHCDPTVETMAPRARRLDRQTGR